MSGLGEKKRMAGSYEIRAAFPIGHRELVIGEYPNAPGGERFMCAFGEQKEFLSLYTGVMVSDDYLEIAALFGQRIGREAERLREERGKLTVPLAVITAADCIPDSRGNDIKGKIIAIDSKALRPEYQRADRQLYRVEGGFGAGANSRGNAVFCTNLYDGCRTRYERMDVLGVVKPECLPDWAREKLAEMEPPKKEKERGR